jgi:small subunit ribosomal protein S6
LRTYEIVVIVEPNATDEALTQLTETLSGIITTQGGTIIKAERMGKRTLAYPIGKFNEGHYLLLETEGTGREIAELERRMRVNDAVVRYMTVRVDLDRRRAEKFKARRARKAEKRPSTIRVSKEEREAVSEE